MDLKLKGKKVLVSGSTAGIGYAIAEVLASEGADVVLNGRTEQRVNQALEKIRAVATGSVQAIAADLGTAVGVRKTLERHPAIDILVNNLGIFDPKPFEDIPDERMGSFLRSERNERCPPEPCVSAVHAEAKLGSHHFYFQRVGHPDSFRNGALRNDEDRSIGDCPRHRRNCEAYGHYC